MVVSAGVAATLWPNAREAWAVLAAQNDPAELSSLQLNSALRNNPGLIRDNIEALLHSARRTAEVSTKLADDAVRRMSDTALAPR